jgi:hypothetical protein
VIPGDGGFPDPIPEGFVDRPSFLKEVGIDSRTLTRWIGEGALQPRRTTRNSRVIQIFSRDNVRFGSALKVILKQHHGQLELHEAVAIVRGEAARPVVPRDPSSSAPLDPLD